MRRFCLPLLFVFTFAAMQSLPDPATADPLLILSGGGQALDNGINHLWNVRRVERFWQTTRQGPVWSLVADGLDETPDAAVAAPFGPEDGRWWLQVLVMRTDGALRFVNGSASSIVGPGTAAGLQEWLQRYGRKLAPEQILTVYVTDHGVHDEGGRGILLWGDDVLSPPQLTALLRALPRHVGVRLVMAQCFSGMFTETVASLLADGRTACGFFSAPADRVAEGCRYDPASTGEPEYTTAMFGPQSPLRRGNDWMAAHLDAVARLDTVDVPVAGSFLFGPPVTAVWRPHPRLETALRTLRPPGQTQPVSRVVLETLTDRLDAAYAELETALFRRWPGLMYLFSAGLPPPAPGDVLDWVRRQPAYADWRLASEALDAAMRRNMRAERDEARTLRRRLLERVRAGVFEQRLSAVQWRRMQRCEGWGGRGGER